MTATHITIAGTLATDPQLAGIKADLGLDQVNNTADLSKPVSTLQAAAIAVAMSSAPIGQPTRLYLGDSLTWYNVTLGLPISSVSAGFGSVQWLVQWAEKSCEGGAGTLTYASGPKTLQWTPLAGTPGAAVDASKTGMILVPGGVAGHGIWVTWFGGSATYTSGSATITISGAGTQLWMTESASQGGYGAWAQAYNRQAFVLAPMPTCPPGADGYYGLAGSVAADLIDSQWQWSRAAVDSAVIQIGTNDCNGGVAVGTFVTNVQAVVTKLLAIGARDVRWLTVTPRNGDTTAQRAWKADAARRLIAWQATQRGRFHVVDIAARITSYASGAAQGQWITGQSFDGIHAASAGAMVIGKAIAEVDRRAAVQGRYWGSVGDVWHVSNNPNGNIMNAVAAGSGWMEGTGGSLGTGAAAVGAWSSGATVVLGQPVIASGRLYVYTAAGVVGTVAPSHTAGQAADGTATALYVGGGAVGGIASGWAANRQVGAAATMACAKMARTDGIPGDWQVLVLYGCSSTEAGRILSTASATGLTAGNQYQADIECLHIASSQLNCMGAQMYLGGTGGADVPQFGKAPTSGTYVHADVTADPVEPLVMSTPPGWVAPVAAANMGLLLSIGARAGGYAVVAYGRTQLRRVA